MFFFFSFLVLVLFFCPWKVWEKEYEDNEKMNKIDSVISLNSVVIRSNFYSD